PNDDGLRMKLANVERAASARTGVGASSGADPVREAPTKRVEEAEPFWDDLGSVLSYPFRGVGPTVLLLGGVLFGIGQLIASFNMFAAVVNIMICGYVAAYFFDVINSSGA